MDAMTVLTGVLVIITGIYAYLTHRMAKASLTSVRLMKEQTDAISRPYVVVSLVKRPNNPFIHLRVENTGQTAATNLRLSLGGIDFEKIKNLDVIKKLSGSHLFTKQIDSFSPRSPVFFLIGSGAAFCGEDAKLHKDTFTVTAHYSFAGQTVSETTTVDVNQYNATSLETDPVVDVLNKIKDEIAKKN